jgi:hypothetical protein
MRHWRGHHFAVAKPGSTPIKVLGPSATMPLVSLAPDVLVVNGTPGLAESKGQRRRYPLPIGISNARACGHYFSDLVDIVLQ